MRESAVDRYFVKKCKEKGWEVLKINPTNRAGFPDRLVLRPGGDIFFAELKAPGEKPRPLQEAVHKRLLAFGYKVFVLDNKKQIDQFFSNSIYDVFEGILDGV